MSESAHPVELPAELARAVEALGSRVKVLLLLSLEHDGSATAAALAQRLRISPEVVRHHVLPLERLGIVDVSPPRSNTEVKRRYYSVNRPVLKAAVGSLDALLIDDAE
jgi:ArsR family transcriptional regulator, cadmium/lead-responsive transcriptional repressor